jgi:recombinational DNA repair protein (RecF pathway)
MKDNELAVGVHAMIGDDAFVVTVSVADEPLQMVTLLTEAAGIFFMVAATGTLSDKHPLTSVLDTA